MSGPDFFDKRVQAEIISPALGPETHPDEEGPEALTRPVGTADQVTHRLLEDIRRELHVLNFQLAIITESDPDELRRDL